MDNFPKSVRFLGRLLPEEGGTVVGYAKLIGTYKLSAPLPQQLALISQRHRKYHTKEWAVYTPRHLPEDSLIGNLTFALRYEGVNLAVISQLFLIINPEIIARWVRLEPTGRYSRRVWFLYEWLTGKQLDVPDTVMGNYVNVLDSKLQQVGSTSAPSRRHRVTNNLPDVHEDVSCGALRPLEWHHGLYEADLKELKTNLQKHYEISDQELSRIIQYLDQNFKRERKAV